MMVVGFHDDGDGRDGDGDVGDDDDGGDGDDDEVGALGGSH